MSCGMKPVMSFGKTRKSSRKHSPHRGHHAKCLSVKTRMARRHRRSRRHSHKHSKKSSMMMMMPSMHMPSMWPMSSKRRSGRKSSRKSSRRSRSRRSRFGVMGPGYAGPTSFENGYAPYFGAQEPFVNASQWWYPNPSANSANLVPKNQPTNYQSPGMLRSYAK